MTEKVVSQNGKSSNYGYLIVVGLVMIMLGPMCFSLSCVGIILPPASEALGVTPATLSYYISMMSIVNIILLPIWGKLFVKYDVRIILTTCVVLVALGFIIESLAVEVWQFYLCALLVGGGMPPLLFIAPSSLINKWFAHRAGFFIGLVMAFMGVGGVIWNPIGGMLIQAVGWRMTLDVFAVIALVITLPFTIFVFRGDPADKGLLPVGAGASTGAAKSAAAQNTEGVTAKQAMSMPLFFLLLAFAVLLNLGLYAYNMIPTYIGTLPIGVAMPMLGATLASVCMASQTVAKLIWGFVGEKNPIVTVCVGLVFGIIGLLGIWAISGEVILIGLFVVLYGFSYALTNVMLPILTRSFFGLVDYPQIYSRVSMTASAGNLLGTVIWGTLINVTGGYTVLFLGTSVGLALGIVAIIVAGSSAKKLKAQGA